MGSQLLTEHQVYQLRLDAFQSRRIGFARRGHVFFADPPPVAQHNHLVAERDDVFKFVGHQQDDDTVPVRQLLQGREEGLLLFGRDSRGGFVQNQGLYAQGQQSNDLKLLPQGDAHAFDRRLGLQFEAQVRRCLFKVPARGLPVRQHPFRTAVDEILKRREGADVQRVLLQHADAFLDGIFRTAETRGHTVDQDVAAVRRLIAGEDFHQRRFARAVFAQNARDAPRGKQHADVVVGVHGTETLVNVAQLDLHRQDVP